MAKTDFKSVADYLATLSPEDQKGVKAICGAIRKAVPDAEETISYQLPAYKYRGGWIFYVSAWKNHYGLSCPPPTGIYEAFKKQLASYEQTKSMIRMPKSEPLPLDLIAEMSRYRAKENIERESSTKKKK
ncbi:MAG TPA: DUF1801 domain-containing protein [Rhizobiaceae bacterium]|nr:DUF1801 domain-containing protein [Rhizobiaceae bacterium]